jgi:hypothetical protein
MRGYVPMAKAELKALIQGGTAAVSVIFLPTERIALAYGVSDLEEAEYGALEVARESTEGTELSLIIAFELSDQLIASGREIAAGVLEGHFSLTNSDVVAFYLITDSEEELEWYDATESDACLAKVNR